MRGEGDDAITTFRLGAFAMKECGKLGNVLYATTQSDALSQHSGTYFSKIESIAARMPTRCA